MAIPNTTVCHELKEYVKRRDGGQYPWIADCSLVKSAKCGCEYCKVACSMANGRRSVEENKELNRAASALNAGFDFGQDTIDRKIVPQLATSGIGFRGDADGNELFVLDRKSRCVLASRQLTLDCRCGRSILPSSDINIWRYGFRRSSPHCLELVRELCKDTQYAMLTFGQARWSSEAATACIRRRPEGTTIRSLGGNTRYCRLLGLFEPLLGRRQKATGDHKGYVVSTLDRHSISRLAKDVPRGCHFHQKIRHPVSVGGFVVYYPGRL